MICITMPDFNQVVAAIGDTIAGLVYGEEDSSSEIVAVEDSQTDANTLANAFESFVHEQKFHEGFYNIHHHYHHLLCRSFAN